MWAPAGSFIWASPFLAPGLQLENRSGSSLGDCCFHTNPALPGAAIQTPQTWELCMAMGVVAAVAAVPLPPRVRLLMVVSVATLQPPKHNL